MKHVVGISGGIDSQAVARWVLNRHDPADVILLNSDAGGNEHPLTTQFLEDYSHKVHPVTFVSPIVADLGTCGTKPGATKVRRQKYKDSDPLTYDVLAEIKGLFPARKMQFCTEHLKLAPANRWMRENLKHGEWIRYTGVRRDESIKRRDAKIGGWDDYFGCEMQQPLADWTKQMCFDYVKAHGEEVNPLYAMGFDRVGCSPCINSKKPDIRNWYQRFPEAIEKVREWESSTGLTFYRMRNKQGDLMWVDEVVDWACTERGGTQLSILYEPPVCESNYGLCE